MNAKAGPSRLPIQTEPPLGLSFRNTVSVLSSFLEVAIHTILCIRQVYPPTTFTRRRAHGVAVYQSRHPEVRSYVAKIINDLKEQMEKGTLRRVTVVIYEESSRIPLERFIIDFGYMGLEGLEGPQRDAKIQGAPDEEGLSLMLRGFLIRLTALDAQLLDTPGDTTFGIILQTKDDLEPEAPNDGSTSPWVPALAGDALDTSSAVTGHHEPLLSVRAVETGVIDLRMVVQECSAKTGTEFLELDP